MTFHKCILKSIKIAISLGRKTKQILSRFKHSCATSQHGHYDMHKMIIRNDSFQRYATTQHGIRSQLRALAERSLTTWLLGILQLP